MQILVVKPGTVRPEDRDALKAAGVFVLEAANPNEVRLINGVPDLPRSELLRCAGVAINKYDSASEAFGHEVAKALADREQPAQESGEGSV